MAANEWEKLWFAVFGAALTLIVTIVNGWGGRWFRAQSVKRGLIAEMYELQYRVAATSWLMAGRLGKLDESLFNEVSLIIKAYKGPEDNAGFVKMLRLLRELSPEMRPKAMEELSRQQLGGSFAVIPYSTPFFAAHRSELRLLPVNFQTQLLRIVTGLDMFNHLAELSERLIERTFVVVDENKTITEAHIRNNNADILNRSRVLMKMISDLPLDRRFSWRWPWRRKS
jgi:hypothetical protein